jgi:hypothetical protein
LPISSPLVLLAPQPCQPVDLQAWDFSASCPLGKSLSFCHPPGRKGLCLEAWCPAASTPSPHPALPLHPPSAGPTHSSSSLLSLVPLKCFDPPRLLHNLGG